MENGDGIYTLKEIYHGSRNIIEKPLFGHGKPIMIMALAFIVLRAMN